MLAGKSSACRRTSLACLKTSWKRRYDCFARHSQQHKTSATSFWYEALAFRDAAGICPFAAVAAGAMRVLTLPVSNAEAERVFSNVTLTKTELRNKMKLDLLESILRIKFGLRLQKETSSSYVIPEEVLRKMTANYSGASSIYE